METQLKRGRSHIYSAILKHGLSNFSISILEYCEPGKCLEREDDYLKLLKPAYNILPKAGS
jgi:group I intron endonuclease